MQSELMLAKNEGEGFNFYELAFDKIKYLDKGRIVSFREITRIWGVNFHFSREQSFMLIDELVKKGWIRKHPFNGISFIRE